jgi:hypothetical protein
VLVVVFDTNGHGVNIGREREWKRLLRDVCSIKKKELWAACRSLVICEGESSARGNHAMKTQACRTLLLLWLIDQLTR